MLAQGFALLSRLSCQVRARDAGAQALWRLFFLHSVTAVDHKYLHDSAASSRWAAKPTAPPPTARALHRRRAEVGHGHRRPVP